MQGLVQAMQTQAHTQAALQAQLEAQAEIPAQDHGGPSIMERFKWMLPPSFKGESDPLLAENWMREIEKIFRAVRCADEDKVTLATYMLQRREEQAEQQVSAPQGPVLPPPPPVDYGVFIQGLVQAMQTQAHTEAALQAQLEAQKAEIPAQDHGGPSIMERFKRIVVLMKIVLQERADVWWASLLRTRFEDGAIDVAWDEFVRLFRAKFFLSISRTGWSRSSFP
ncbi:hypothetical protein Taro_000204 [Colocasia esculenta]|uniref:Gag protein n=1 Tax=Colocasia esculenta TaxID=4460 RepID=A0A843T744_COLES|nr:hypothetical protein [Colocasia esculenta]